jgi:16S rRNA (cytosine1402-N4)-methyltransferase
LASPHRPVLVSEVVKLLAGKATVIDATVGAGGHAEALLEAGVGSVLGLDRDPAALGTAETRLARFGARFRGVLARFSTLTQIARRVGLIEAGGVLFDLGVSSMQLDEPERGFSYRSVGPLDMRMGPNEPDRPSAGDVVNSYSEDELTRVIGELGEDRMARRIARAIVRARIRAPISTTQELAAIVAGAVPRRRGGPHPARRTFQAIRIEVNAELEELAASLPQAVGLLEPAGRLVVISYHSLEDRIVKRFVSSDGDLASLTRKVIRPSAEEAAANPRSRSARLRAAERLSAA